MSFYFEFPSIERKSKTNFDCNKCTLKNNKIQSPEMQMYVGEQYEGLIILGNKASKHDDEKGFPFADSRSKILRSTAAKFRINLSKQAAMLHAVSCYNPTKKKTSDTHFKCCQSILDARLKELRPKLIICCGELAFKYIFGLKNKYAISKLRNRIIPNYQYNCLVFPVYDPYNYEMYNTRKEEEELSYYYEHAYKWDLQRIFELWDKKFHKRTEVNKVLKERKILENIEIKEVTDFHEAKELFRLWNKSKAICLDYETTNLFPYDNHFEIVYAAFGNKTNAWVFHEDFWKDNPFVKIWFKRQMQRILVNQKVLKVVQNSKFEDLCSRFVYGIKEIKNSFCTMLAQHVIDEREGCTSLDFQNLIRFGIPPYNETIKKYLITDKKAKEIESDDSEDEMEEIIELDEAKAYTFQKVNKIREAPKQDMIQYNGLDVITAFNQWVLFEKDLLDSYPKARENYEFLNEGHWLFARMSQRGVNIGEQELKDFELFLEKEIERIEKKIMEIPEIQEYNKHLESKSSKTKKKKNDKQLEDLCFSKPKKIRLINRKFDFTEGEEK